MEIPEDVLMEILSRLAVKTLLRFKCACKQWRRLISSRFFAHVHLNRSISNPTRHSILLQEAGRILPLDALSFSPVEKSNLELDRFTKYGQHDFVGSINGLVCLEIFFQELFAIAILNPSTRFAKEIRTKDLQPGGSCTGFGWDPTANDYKVFRLCYWFQSFGDLRNCVQVWSANLQYWREYELNCKITPLQSHFKLVMEGFAYCIVIDGTSQLITQIVKRMIACFDVKNEVLRLIPIPQLLLDSVSSYFLMNWKGTFAFAALIKSTNVYRVWTMDDDPAGGESWSNKFTFEVIDTVPNNFATSVNGTQVLLRGLPGELILYDIETREIRKIKSSYRLEGISVFYYVESLLSIPWIPRRRVGTKTNGIVHTRRGSGRLNILLP